MSPAYSHHRRVWSLAWPMIVANLSVPLLGLVDTAILGHLDDSRYLSGVAIGSSMIAFAYWSFGFLRMGASAQAQNEPEAAAVLLKSLLLAPLIALAILILAPLWLPFGLALMNTSSELLPLAEHYLVLRLPGVFAVMATYAAVGWLIGQQKTGWTLTIALTTNFGNILLDLLFVVVLDLRSAGAALASTLSEYIGLYLAGYALRQPLRLALTLGLRHCLYSGLSLVHFVQQNLQLFLRTVALLFSFAFFTAQSAELGITVLAANIILLQLALAAAYGMDGFAHAIEALAGRAFAKGDRSLFIGYCKASAQLAGVSAALAAVLLVVGKSNILAAMTSLAEVSAVASTYYLYLVAMPIISMASYTLDGIFVGAMQTRAMQWMMLLSLGAVYLPVWFALHASLGNHAIWIALLAFNAARGITLGVVFARVFSPARWPAQCST